VLNQAYFEMTDVRPLMGRAWIPLRQDTDEDLETIPGVSAASRYLGLATLAAFSHQYGFVDRLDWSDLSVQPHRSHYWTDGYHPADLFLDNRADGPVGINLVIDQDLEGAAPHEWHLHPDLVVALRLVREGDTWFRPDEGWIEVVRLVRVDGKPVKLEIRAEHLADYLVARDMRLYASSYHERVARADVRPAFSWGDDFNETKAGRDHREGRIVPWREFGPAEGYRVMGALWRTEWFDPGDFSPRLRGDKDANPIAFATGPRGDRVTSSELQRGIDWLYFEPALVGQLLRYRGARLHWHSKETGGLGAAEARLHFGINGNGLINVLAKDIDRLQPWEQRIWASHSVASDGGVSDELFQSQMMVEPAATMAPEVRLAKAITDLDHQFEAQFGAPLFRPNGQVEPLTARIHRFRVAEPEGLLALAKDSTRLIIERVDLDAVRRAAVTRRSPLAANLKALKALERLAAVQVGDAKARTLMAPLFGVYDLRLADAHLSSEPLGGLERVGVDLKAPTPMQGSALIDRVAGALEALGQALTAATDKPES